MPQRNAYSPRSHTHTHTHIVGMKCPMINITLRGLKSACGGVDTVASTLNRTDGRPLNNLFRTMARPPEGPHKSDLCLPEKSQRSTPVLRTHQSSYMAHESPAPDLRHHAGAKQFRFRIIFGKGILAKAKQNTLGTSPVNSTLLAPLPVALQGTAPQMPRTPNLSC